MGPNCIVTVGIVLQLRRLGWEVGCVTIQTLYYDYSPLNDLVCIVGKEAVENCIAIHQVYCD